MDSRSHCFIWDVCASLLIPYPVVSPGWRRRFMELSELAQQRHCRAYFPVGCSRAGDLPDSGEWLCYVAQRFPSSGACTLRFHKVSAVRRAGSPECNQIGCASIKLSSLSRLERVIGLQHADGSTRHAGADTGSLRCARPLDACVASRSHDNCAAATVVVARLLSRALRKNIAHRLVLEPSTALTTPHRGRSLWDYSPFPTVPDHRG